MLGELPRRGLLDDRAAHAAREAHALALELGAGVLPDLERLRVLAELDADFLENSVGVALDDLQAFLVQDLVVGDRTRDVGDGGGRTRGTGDALGFAAARAGAARGLSLLLFHHGCVSCQIARSMVTAPGPG